MKRYGNFEDFSKKMEEVEGGIEEMALGYEYFGASVETDNTFVMRQWAPGALAMWIFGDFNDWNQFERPLEKQKYGRWEVRIPPTEDGQCRVKHMSKLKLTIKASLFFFCPAFFMFYSAIFSQSFQVSHALLI